MMKKEEAKHQILEEWGTWKRINPRGDLPEGYHWFHFFQYLEADKPHLLRFRSADPDQWQVVKGWIMNHEDQYQ